ncbi:hypothetical protein VPH35_113104 [Triticum aestivum]
MVAALWDILAKAANLAQMSGLHIVMLVTVGMSLLGIPQSRRECAKLERCNRRLHTLLQWPAGGAAALPCSEMGGPVLKALIDAAGLVASYKKSTLWHRVRRGTSMAIQLRDMQDVVDSYCGLLLYVNAYLLLQHMTYHPWIREEHGPLRSQTVQGVSNCPRIPETRGTQRANDFGEEGIGNQIGETDPAGREGSVTA